MNRQATRPTRAWCGFTLVELIIVIAILAIASLVAIPVFSTGADMQVRSAANKIAADLDYAKGLAITHQKKYTVVFASASESYQVQDVNEDAIAHPLRQGLFVENLTADRRVGRVDIVSTNLNGDAVTFDYLGTPYSGTTADPDNRLTDSGCIVLKADAFTLKVNIEPMTGYVTITP